MKSFKIIDKLNRQIKNLKSSSITTDLSTHKIFAEKIHAARQHLLYKQDTALQHAAQRLLHEARSSNNVNLDLYLPEAYALVMEACIRRLGIHPYDEQLMGAIALHYGQVVEMQTGEGKTLTAVFPAYLNALSGKGVHILTFNDYLAQRDAHWMKPVYEFLGMSVGFIQQSMTPHEKSKAYHCDVTYSTAREVGFDYLRAGIAYTTEDITLREFHYAIVDEADAILIDEARNPLVLAGNIEPSSVDHYAVAAYVATLRHGPHYLLDEYSRNIYLTEQGIENTEKHFAIADLQDHTALYTAINLGLQAKVLLHKDVDYVVKDDKIKLIDEFTGRIMEDRRWQNGLQTAVEAKENLPIQSDGTILGSISFQHFMQRYPKLAGMTGTALDAAEEFADFYNLGITIIPPHLPSRRINYPDVIFAHKEAKQIAIIEEIKTAHRVGRPVLVGTLTVRESEALATRLSHHNIPCHVLNAKNDAHESAIIARAGMMGAVTISTNMAGRGTDIILGGESETDKEAVIRLGGLLVIGTNRHENIRIDNQLRGRAGRQGDPGATKFIISMQDDLMLKYRLRELLPEKFRNLHQHTPLAFPVVARGIAQAQRIIAGQMHAIRKTLYIYSSFIEKQRIIFQNRRRQILANAIDSNLTRLQREYLLIQYDTLWAQHLITVAQLKEGIHWERIGGNEPVRVFHKRAHEYFMTMLSELEASEDFPEQLVSTAERLKVRRPSSTYTYLINDNPFRGGLGTLVAGISNIGFQVDFFTAWLWPIIGLFSRRKKNNNP